MPNVLSDDWITTSWNMSELEQGETRKLLAMVSTIRNFIYDGILSFVFLESKNSHDFDGQSHPFHSVCRGNAMESLSFATIVVHTSVSVVWMKL